MELPDEVASKVAQLMGLAQDLRGTYAASHEEVVRMRKQVTAMHDEITELNKQIDGRDKHIARLESELAAAREVPAPLQHPNVPNELAELKAVHAVLEEWREQLIPNVFEGANAAAIVEHLCEALACGKTAEVAELKTVHATLERWRARGLKLIRIGSAAAIVEHLCAQLAARDAWDAEAPPDAVRERERLLIMAGRYTHDSVDALLRRSTDDLRARVNSAEREAGPASPANPSHRVREALRAFLSGAIVPGSNLYIAAKNALDILEPEPAQAAPKPDATDMKRSKALGDIAFILGKTSIDATVEAVKDLSGDRAWLSGISTIRRVVFERMQRGLRQLIASLTDEQATALAGGANLDSDLLVDALALYVAKSPHPERAAKFVTPSEVHPESEEIAPLSRIAQALGLPWHATTDDIVKHCDPRNRPIREGDVILHGGELAYVGGVRDNMLRVRRYKTDGHVWDLSLADAVRIGVWP